MFRFVKCVVAFALIAAPFALGASARAAVPYRGVPFPNVGRAAKPARDAVGRGRSIVAPGGRLELPTNGLTVRCSAN